MVSGQPPNPMTQADCQIYQDFAGTVGSDGVAVGQGCVFPTEVKTVADQLEAKGLTWKGYMEDQAASSTDKKTCRHPALNQHDGTQTARADDQYAARHNPFVYFHSIIDRPICDTNVLDLSALPGDLASKNTTPSLLVHHARPVQRRPRRPMRRRPPRRPQERQRLPDPVDPEDHRLARLRGRRPPDRHLRRGRE